MNIGGGIGGAGGAVAPTTKLGEQLHPDLPFFCNLLLKVTLQSLRLLLTQKFSKIPRGFAQWPHGPRCTVYTAYTFFDKYTLHKVILGI